MNLFKKTNNELTKARTNAMSPEPLANSHYMFSNEISAMSSERRDSKMRNNIKLPQIRIQTNVLEPHSDIRHYLPQITPKTLPNDPLIINPPPKTRRLGNRTNGNREDFANMSGIQAGSSFNSPMDYHNNS
jgi:hypothetical protein